jgi:hypothetical protein
VYGVPPTAKVPGFVADASWPQKLPNNWIIGQVGGLYVAPDDHIWVYQRPRTLTNDEAALTDATHKTPDGKPVDAMGNPRPYGVLGDCCVPAPSVMEFDANGKLLQAWGGPADRASAKWRMAVSGRRANMASTSITTASCTSPERRQRQAQRVGLGVDQRRRRLNPEIHEGRQVPDDDRRPTKGADSNNKDGGKNGTPLFFLVADLMVDPTTNRLYVSDGYGNRRVVIVDAATGKYIGHFGAYGNNPVDDKAAAAAGPWMNDFTKGNMKPAFFRTPVQLREGEQGRLDLRLRPRQQPHPGLQQQRSESRQECANPSGEAGKCGFVKEQQVAIKTNGLPGSAVSMNFSTDAKQSCLYIGDNSNMTIYILNRENLQELGRLGRSGRANGEFHWLHQVSVDTHGNIYTAEVDTGKANTEISGVTAAMAAGGTDGRRWEECCLVRSNRTATQSRTLDLTARFRLLCRRFAMNRRRPCRTARALPVRRAALPSPLASSASCP